MNSHCVIRGKKIAKAKAEQDPQMAANAASALGKSTKGKHKIITSKMEEDTNASCAWKAMHDPYQPWSDE
eukprot:2000032-Prorocentrum_lima.AAC.1